VKLQQGIQEKQMSTLKETLPRRMVLPAAVISGGKQE